MNEWGLRWLYLAGVVRYGSLLAVTLGLLMLGWILWLRPLQLEQQRLLTALSQQQHTLRQRQQQLAQNPPLETLQQQLTQTLAQLRSAAIAPALETMLAVRGRQLEHWQPDAQPQVLTLHLQWRQFQPLFSELAQAGAPFPHYSQLAMQQTQLVAELWLEQADAP